MRGTMIGLTMAGSLAMAGCTADMGSNTVTGAAAGGAKRATATLVDATGARKGTAMFRQTPGGVVMDVRAMGLPPGPKGLHIHLAGRCDAPDFTTAGGHWNPTTMKHGRDAPMGPHMGDLPNIDIAANGTGKATATITGATLTGGANPMLDADGASVMIHAGPDDYKTDPSGNSGARIACGVIGAA